MIYQLIEDLSNAEAGLRALSDTNSRELAKRIREYLPRLLKESGLVLTPAGRGRFRSAALQRMLDSSARNLKRKKASPPIDLSRFKNTGSRK